LRAIAFATLPRGLRSKYPVKVQTAALANAEVLVYPQLHKDCHLSSA